MTTNSAAHSRASQIRALLERTTAFIQNDVIPIEIESGGSVHDKPESFRIDLQDAARSAQVFAPQVAPERGGFGLTITEQSQIFEAAGYSLLGPLAMNCSAPDEGNMHLLEVVATDQQKERYLAPLAAGDIRSCFAMTEPSPGAGSDPMQLQTRATRVASGWRIDGLKWFITGATGADFAITMARTNHDDGTVQATMFLVDMNNPGVTIERNLDTLDEGLFGGHGQLRFDNCVVSEDSVLGEVNEGFGYAQVRLGPARLTHCMRWLGVARRSHDIAIEYSIQREAFGSRLGDLGMVQQMIADSEIDIAASRGLILAAASELDAGHRAGHETSVAKTFVAEAVNRIVDRSLQICGALGVSGDVLLSRYMREVRPFRIYDGPSETHRWSIARRAIRRAEGALANGQPNHLAPFFDNIGQRD